MIRYLSALLLSLVLLPTGVSAQQGAGERGTPQQQRACRHDVLRHCREVKDRDDFTIETCLRAHYSQISTACRQVLSGGGR